MFYRFQVLKFRVTLTHFIVSKLSSLQGLKWYRQFWSLSSTRHFLSILGGYSISFQLIKGWKTSFYMIKPSVSESSIMKFFENSFLVLCTYSNYVFCHLVCILSHNAETFISETWSYLYSFALLRPLQCRQRAASHRSIKLCPGFLSCLVPSYGTMGWV